MRLITQAIFIIFLVRYSNQIKKTSLNVLLSQTNCTTPDGANGYCLYVHLCKPILDLLPTDMESISSDAVELIRTYLCPSNDTESTDLLVCCTQQPIPNDDDAELGLIPPDVTKHKHLKLLPKYCGISEDAFRIIGGHEASLFEFTWMAQIAYSTNKGIQFKCAGTIINRRYILTAAHCVTNLKNETLIGVKVGEYNRSSETDCEYYPEGETICADPVQDLKIEDTIVHPNFNYVTLSSDIALIRVSNDIKLTRNNISPICLPIYKNLRELNLERAVVTGWGRNELKRSGKVLHKVGLSIVDPKECRRIYYQFRMILSHLQICAGDEGKDACDGDSGGPLQSMADYNGQARYVQFGIISYGPADCGSKNRPGIYVNVIYYMKWILDNIKK